jgi:hypothetical protein
MSTSNGRTDARAVTATWERDDGVSQGHSIGRLAPTDEGGWTAHGHEVLVAEPPVGCFFEVVLDDAWWPHRASVTSLDGSGERRVTLQSEGEGRWSVDGQHRADLDGARDVDVAATPLTNTFPIRRLAGLREGETATITVAWVEVPSLRVIRVEQTYRRLPDVDGLAAWEYGDAAHGSFRLTVDDVGLVVDYEGFARRVARS